MHCPVVDRCTVGWSDFWRKKCGHMSCCSRLLWDPKSKILLWSVAFSLGGGPHKASENFACNPKISNIFKGFSWNKICSLFYLKAKNEEKSKKKFNYFLGKNSLRHFRKIKIKTTNFEFWIFFLTIGLNV